MTGDLRRFIGSFTMGMGAKTYKPMVFGICTVLALLVFVEYALRSGLYTVISERYLSASSRNDWSLHTSYRIGTVKRTPPEGYVVYLLGGSTGRAAYTEDIIEKKLSSFFAMQIDTYNLSLVGSSFEADIALVNEIPQPVDKAFVVITISAIGRFNYNSRYFRRGNEVFISYANYVDGIVAKMRYRFVLSSASNKIVLYLQNIYNMILRGKIEFKKIPENYAVTVATPERAEKKVEDYIRRAQSGLYSLPHIQERVNVFEKLVDIVQKRGFIPIVVELPMNHVYIKGRLESMFIYNPMLKAICAARDIPYLDYQRVAYPGDAFTDIIHMNAKGRELFQPQFINDLAAIIKAHMDGVQP